MAAAAPPRAPEKDMAPILQELNIPALQRRTMDLQGAVSRMLVTFQTQKTVKWQEALDQFAVVNAQLINLVEDMKGVLKMFIIRPNIVTGETAPVLPIMLSSKSLPEMEAQDVKIIANVVAPFSHLPPQAQVERLQRQVEALKMACETAERAVTEGRKRHGLDARRGQPAAGPKVDPARAARLADQEKLLRSTAVAGGTRRPPEPEKPPLQPTQMTRMADLIATPAGHGLPRPPSSVAPRRPGGVPQATSPSTSFVRTPHTSTPGPGPVTTPGQTSQVAAVSAKGLSPGISFPASPDPRSPTSLSPNFPVAVTAATNAPFHGQQQQPQPQPQQQQQQQQQQPTNALLLQQQQQQLQMKHDHEQQLLMQQQQQQMANLHVALQQQHQRQMYQQQQQQHPGAMDAVRGIYGSTAPSLAPQQYQVNVPMGQQGLGVQQQGGALPQQQQRFVGHTPPYGQQR